MTTTTMYVFDQDTDASRCAEFGNAWRSAPMLWDYLLVNLGLGGSGPMAWPRLWGDERGIDAYISGKAETDAQKAARTERAKAIEARLKDHEWWALMTTCDRHVIKAECASDLVEALRMVHADLVRFNGEGRQEPSFGEQADMIVKVMEEHPKTYGFGWNQTSVSDTWPWVRIASFDPDAVEDEEEDNVVEPRLNRDGGYHLITGLRESAYVDPMHDGYKGA